MVFHADVDEFLALMNPLHGNLADLSLQGCLEGVTQGVMWPDETRASNCTFHHQELECFMQGAHPVGYADSTAWLSLCCCSKKDVEFIKGAPD